MNLEQLTLQCCINRILLRNLYENQDFYKECKKEADEAGNKLWEYACHNNLKRLKKDIAPLVALQKTIKAEIKRIVSYRRALKHVAAFSAKRAAMDRAGECYE